MGCDYDRANSDNSHLSISPSTNSGNIYGGGRMVISSSNNKDNLTFDWNIKSGKFHDGILGAAEGGTQSIYLGSSQAPGSSLQYIGKRRLVIEGGEMASIAGGMNSASGTNGGNNYDNDYTTGTAKDVVTIRMRGGNARGSIYGAAAFAGAKGGRTFVITGGTVLGWIAGGANGTHTDGGELYGNTYIYVGGKVNVGNSSGGNHVGDIVRYQNTTNGPYYYGQNGADGGSIFGAGCGILTGTYSGSWPTGTFTANNDYQDDDYTVGRVNNSNVVIADEATIWRDVYGGGNYGYVRANGTGSVSILGGVIKGNVYGGGYGSSTNMAAGTSVSVSGGTITMCTVAAIKAPLRATPASPSAAAQ